MINRIDLVSGIPVNILYRCMTVISYSDGN